MNWYSRAAAIAGPPIRRLSSTETGARLRTAVLWGGLSTLVGRGLPVLAMVLTARVLGPSEFGRLTLLYSTAMTFEVFVTAGLAVVCTKFVSELHRTNPARAGRIIDLANLTSAMTAIAIGAIVVAISPWLARSALASPDLATPLAWGALLIAILSSAAIQQSTLLGLEAFRATAVIEAFGGLATLVIVPLGAYTHGLVGAFGAIILSSLFRLLALQMAVARETRKRGIPRSWAIPRDGFALLWHFALPTMLNSLLVAPVSWCALAMVAAEINGHEEIGLFNAANQWFALLVFLPTVINHVTFPILTEKLSAGATDTAWRMFRGKIVATVCFMTVALVLVSLLSPYIMRLYGDAYAGASHVLIAVAFAAWFAAPLAPLGNIIIAHGRPWTWFAVNIAWALVLLLVVFFLRQHGALALALGHACAYAMKTFVAVQFVVRLRSQSFH